MPRGQNRLSPHITSSRNFILIILILQLLSEWVAILQTTELTDAVSSKGEPWIVWLFFSQGLAQAIMAGYVLFQGICWVYFLWNTRGVWRSFITVCCAILYVFAGGALYVKSIYHIVSYATRG